MSVFTRYNAELKTTVAKIDKLRVEIDAIVAEIDLPALSALQAGGRQEAD